jgi:hypothetical protein
MEPQKRARYSNRLDAEELEEILMEEESHEESMSSLNLVKISLSSSSSSGNEAEDVDIRFRARRPRDSPKVLDFTDSPSGINRSAASNIYV